MKFDTAPLEDSIDGDRELAAAVGLRPGAEPIWVCGSTGPGEEAIVLDAYAQLLKKHPALRLVISPRKPERFDEAAALITSRGFELVRRSHIRESGSGMGDSQFRPVVLGDTMGELRKFYSVAEVVFVGRTLVDLGVRQHGSDMIEPAALGKPVVVGPFTGNFAEPMRCFQSADAIRIIQRPEELAGIIDQWLAHPSQGAEMGRRAREVVQANRGATKRHAQVLLELIDSAER
jgi:3-deoxy-D-manno-octulosonic-acid transferase